MDKKDKFLFYRRAEFVQDTTTLTLQEMLQQTLKIKDTIGLRKEEIGQTSQQVGSWSRFINNHQSAHGMEFGVLVMIEPGQNRLLIENIDDKDQLDVSQIPPPAGMDFMESYLCYGIKDNHVIVLQSIALKTKQLEAHLFWLLGSSCSAIIGEDNGVFLNNYAPQNTFDMVENNSVDSVSLHVPLGSTETLQAIDNDGSAANSLNVQSSSFRAGNRGLDVLRALFPSDRVASLLESDTTHADQEIEVMVEVKRKRRIQNIAESTQSILNSVANTMRYIDSDEIKIKLDNGTTLSGDTLTVKTKEQFSSVNGILDMQEVFLKMSNWLRDLIENEEIVE